MIFYFIRSITFDVFGPIHAASKCCMIPLPTILALGYTWVYICISDCYDIVKNTRSRLNFFYFPFFIFIFFSIYFYIFRTLGLGLEVICHTVTSVTSDGVVTTLIIGLKRRFWNKVMSYNMDTTYWPHA